MIAKTMEAQTRSTFGHQHVFATRIRTNTLVEQAVGMKQTVYELDGRAPAAKDYLDLADEVTKACKRLAPEVLNGQAQEAAAR
jgi:cellulose biosynthesis protein BcsQ